MSYKPEYCCQCGDKIERIEWKAWTSRRFCDLCATDHFFYEWYPQIAGIGLVLALFVIGAYFQKSDKPLNVSTSQLVGSVNNSKIVLTNQNAAPDKTNAAVQTVIQSNSSPLLVKAANQKISQVADAPVESSEKVYFCGAATKKGTPCSRRVRGGGRCWQHTGQTAMMAQDKLLAVQ